MTPWTGVDISQARVLDGGLATELERRGLELSGPLWSGRILARAPEVILAVHLDYLRAGADCILTSSYQVSALGFEESGEVNAAEAAANALRRSVELAEQARRLYSRESDRHVLIAASLGSYGAALHNGAEFHGNYAIGFDALVRFHEERIAVLAETPADLIAFETVPSLEEARAIMTALKRFPAAGAWVSFTCRDEQHVAHGEPLATCFALLQDEPQVLALGINCTAPQLVGPLLRSVSSLSTAALGAPKPYLVYPNSGEIWDSAARCWRGTADPGAYEALAQGWYAAGAGMVGGCCRTGPAHIRSVVRASVTHAGTAAFQDTRQPLGNRHGDQV